MDKLEKVELVREKTGASYADAKAALEACGYDVLDAIIALENQGKANSKSASYTTSSQPSGEPSPEMAQAQREYRESSARGTFRQMIQRFFYWLRDFFKQSLEVSFVAERKGERIVEVPATVLIILAIVAFWVTLPLLVLGLFLGFRYRFDGIGNINVDINSALDKAADGAENLKRDMMHDHEDNLADEVPEYETGDENKA